MELNSLLESTLQGLGYELVDLELSNQGKLLRVFIDKPDGINVEDCVLVSNHISRLLAVEMDFEYDRLEVSSPGLDRPVKKEADFVRFRGEKAQVKLRIPLQGRKKFVGTIMGVQDGCLQLEVEGAVIALDLTNIDKARLVPQF
ncbi:ribosome maturation factor RimP [Acidithiobacillus sp.]|uniref:ribosome maturation factor RimP n=1 Tax=Acidithiobacillus sp. TaxID=1872118 RepID=UPI00258C49DA|nr:ribosome maturation factor RimP [Acidithiobacillus sp.]MDD5376110.1 ribosome maturation factor RimP [Acidithiobacillus sp.]